MLELRPAAPWISASAPVFRAPLRCAGLMIGLPCFGGMVGAPTLRGLLEAQRALISLGVPVTCVTVSHESLIPRARNAVVAHFLASDCSHLLFVDADIGFGADSVLRLLALDRAVAGGMYRRKRADRADWVVWWPEGTSEARRDPDTGALEVAALGAGFLLLRRDAVERMTAAYPGARCTADPDEGPEGGWRDRLFALFDTGIEAGTGRYLGEDRVFCARWRAIGGEIWCDPAILLHHHGQASFAGDPLLGTAPDGAAPRTG